MLPYRLIPAGGVWGAGWFGADAGVSSKLPASLGPLGSGFGFSCRWFSVACRGRALLRAAPWRSPRWPGGWASRCVWPAVTGVGGCFPFR